ncbi:MAG: DNA polymerase III subunit gamma and tau [Yaniella sp.]|nr:DNA polymerase III subunit gamma and tau [Yaniella sp.]
MTTALYRRYRPDSFAQVIGQEHVTVPLANAIDKHRINHAYLFSGPRGCGKTTSARILARCLNCAQGPTATPCGQCDSCTDLATGGSGSLDVIEIDAASHGGVDDARDLRERATFAPTRDRYKVFIIDEAHMVTPAGFNALLKIVEEPPEHIKFIFATTEPDKVIGTIRSRTHHYPFRLVPPEPLMQYLETLAGYEQIPIAPGVLSLVIRAGGGSVRDTLSVLDQLLAGATQEGVSYDLAVNLLGFTPENLLDDVVNALAAEDSPTVFRVVDQVVQSGQDPERFVQDLLERFRDVVIVRAAPEQAAGILHGMPEDQLRRLEAQAQQLGAAEVSRAADITAAALTQMNGATSPRLHLELLMARLMLPATDETERGLAARMDRLERRIEYGGVPEASAGNPQPRQPAPQAAAPAEETGLSGAAAARAALLREREAEEASEEQSAVEPQQPAAQPQPAPRPERQPEPQARPEPTPEPQQAEPVNDQPAQPVQPVQSNVPEVAVPPQAPATPEQPTEQQAAQQPSQVEMARRAWPEVLEFLKNESRLIWMTVNGNAQVVGFDGKLLTIGFDNDGARNTVQMRGGANLLSAGFNHVLGIQPELDLISGTPDGGSPKGSSRPARQQPQPARQRPQARPEQPSAAEQQRPTQNPAQPAPPVAPQNTADPPPQASAQPSSPQPPQQPARPPQQSQPRPAPQSAPQPAPIHPQPPATGVAGWGTGQPDQAWGQPEPDWGEPDPNWGPPDDDEWMPNEDPWNPQPPENSATPQPPQQAEPAETQQSAPQQPAPVEEPSSSEPEIATGPDPVASDGYAGFIPRNEQAEEPVIPAFAKSEAELRQEFQRRFGDVIPGSSGKKPQQDSPKPASGSRFADMVAQYGGQPQSGSESETAPQEEKTPDDDDDDYASEDDEIIEDSGLAGRSVVENVLNGRLVEERNADGSPKL